MIVKMAHNQSYWASIDADIESHLKKAIPIRPPVSVFEPMHYLVFAAPRTTAPALCVASCELVGGHRDQAMAAASAIHLMHAASYTHEHLPLTDRPMPRPTIPHAFNPNVELLTGDGIMPFGFELLARSDDPAQNNSDRILRAIIEITRAAGSQGMVDGQYLQVQMQGGQLNGAELHDAGWIEHVCKKKEGMINGLLYGVGKNEKGMMELVERLRKLALKELESFNDRKVESISSIVEANLCSV
ncbi:hypothetical protein F0562_010094 [Nyssa sinensis]|uniref:Uncharacterized protein n=1 Tax=Nyssa sinensis TaxID=561372 RepID=A0A5J5A2M2_9ASTE|nr:hypothetical protein F0562_010094 [Nyssa sinensis]